MDYICVLERVFRSIAGKWKIVWVVFFWKILEIIIIIIVVKMLLSVYWVLGVFVFVNTCYMRWLVNYNSFMGWVLWLFLFEGLIFWEEDGVI